jgi:hypothetical protein
MSEQKLTLEEQVAPQYGRVKGASWFPLLYKRDVMVLGQGGIGSWVSLLLSRVGANLYIYDMDHYEEHNMTGQVVRKSDTGKPKVAAMSDIIKEFSPDCEVNPFNIRYEEATETNDVVICGFDNMNARRTSFNNWKSYVQKLPMEDRKNCFFQDGRLLSEHMQIFNIPGDREDLIKKYEDSYLPSDEEFTETEEPDCTFKQTSHCAAMIGSHMVGFLTNWISNAQGKGPKRIIPFLYEYSVSLNMTENA